MRSFGAFANYGFNYFIKFGIADQFCQQKIEASAPIRILRRGARPFVTTISSGRSIVPSVTEM